MYTYIYIYTYIHVQYVCTYIYIYIEREREKETTWRDMNISLYPFPDSATDPYMDRPLHGHRPFPPLHGEI